ncbi:hypothetical protein BWQ96_06607 [Gracilariopsis chorda]|uniref:NAD(P)-binding domain-containing protein n=1 Tax=Gracilariopsis chorda TaxID=448386 RepID=A0A2V3INI8_9FLOR|nr:hypothetical protein BWQ96_06607 [Gracilariopsis chorda]|eukprot:PXF43648.1 hypothetical protein BWQ96_06607 [Gracilariopsis chorda]
MTASILIIGANGRMGQNLIHAATLQTKKPHIHAFVRNPLSLPPSVASLCYSVHKGDALCSDDVQAALTATSATHVVVAVGVPDSNVLSSLRTDSANTITEAISRSNQTVQVVVVSSIGAGGTRIKFSFGLGTLFHFMLQHVLTDHDHQEERFLRFFENDKERLLIVRPTQLTDGYGGDKVILFDGQQKTPTLKVDRRDVSVWILGQICGEGDCFGRAVNITRAL